MTSVTVGYLRLHASMRPITGAVMMVAVLAEQVAHGCDHSIVAHKRTSPSDGCRLPTVGAIPASRGQFPGIQRHTQGLVAVTASSDDTFCQLRAVCSVG